MTAGEARTGFAAVALLAAFLGGGAAGAQTVPEGQSCGGLFCDLGIVGHKVPSASASTSAAAPASAAASTSATAPTDQRAADSAEPRRPAQRKKPLAKVAAAPAPSRAVPPALEAPVTAKPVTSKPFVTKPLVAKPLVAKPVAVEPAAAEPVTAKPAEPAAASTTGQAAANSVINNPYAVPQASPFQFQSIDPRLQ